MHEMKAGPLRSGGFRASKRWFPGRSDGFREEAKNRKQAMKLEVFAMIRDWIERVPA
jgi:hypothetical protein